MSQDFTLIQLINKYQLSFIITWSARGSGLQTMEPSAMSNTQRHEDPRQLQSSADMHRYSLISNLMLPDETFRSCQGRLEEIYHLSLCVIRVLLKTYGESLQSKV